MIAIYQDFLIKHI